MNMRYFTFSKSALALVIAAMLPLCAWSQTLRGDVNEDGVVDVSDVTMLISFVLNGTPDYYWNIANVDASPDGVVDVSDVSFLIYLILNHDSTAPERTFTVNGVPFTMIRVEPGTFIMGTDDYPDWFPSARPAHQVTLTKAYYVGQTEVTQELWEAVMGTKPSAYPDPLNPVNMVPMYLCKLFCNKLEALTGMHFRLLTEAEWEFAARGGNLGHGYLYAGSDNIDEVAWYKDNSYNTLHHVGTKAPNELGLYDMSGNAHEWVQDYYSYYPSTPQTDPCATEYFERRIIRGGSIGSYEGQGTVVFHRDWIEESLYGALTTLRVAYTAP